MATQAWRRGRRATPQMHGQAATAGRRGRAWWSWLVGGGAGAVLYFLVPPFAGNGLMYNALGLGAAAAILVGVRRNRPSHPGPWRLFAAGQLLFVLGDVVYYTSPRITGHEVDFPSVGDLFYLAVYPTIILGVVRLIRARNPRRDRASLIDALILTTAFATVAWVYLIAPFAHQDGSSVLATVASMAYPLMDVLLVAVVARLAMGPGRREPAFHLLVLGAVALTATDFVYGYVTLHGDYQPGSALDAGWLAYYLLWAAAALHPSMRALSDGAPTLGTGLSPGRRRLLTAATLVAPAVLIVQVMGDGHFAIDEIGVTIAASVALYLLAMARMSGLVRDHEEGERRERALREAATGLVVATSAERSLDVAVRAAAALAGGETAVRVCRVRDDSAFAVVAAHPPLPAGVATGPVAIDEGIAAELARRTMVLRASSDLPREALGLPAGHQLVLLSPLVMDRGVEGFVAVSSPGDLPKGTREGISALASQLALALDAIRLTEELQRRRHEARFRSLVQNASDVVVVIDHDSVITFLSPSAERVFGYRAADMLGTPLLDSVHADDRPSVVALLAQMAADRQDRPIRVESRWRRADGGWAITESMWTDLSDDPDVEGVVLNTRDITERKEAEDQLAHQAFHDPVTGLANRHLFRNRVDHALHHHRRDGLPLAVLFIDLDDFKTVNDSLGHAAGDLLLREVAARFGACARAADTVARLGGDEFAVLLDQSTGAEAVRLAERLLEALEPPLLVDGKEVFPRASIGIAVASAWDSRPGPDADALLRDADVAMYMAKSQGKGRYQVFEPSMHERVLDRLDLHASLQRALTNDELLLHYQPVVELATGRVQGVEALLRWRHPLRGLVPPDDFIPHAEETGVIVPMGRWVLEEACRTGAALRDANPSGPPLTVAVNLSARQLQHPDVLEHVSRALALSGFDPCGLVVEITESVMMEDAAACARTLAALKRLGVKVAIDDFGTGYSSLTHIRELPIDILKADKSFIDRMSDGPQDTAVTAAIMELGNVLDLETVAEGVETPEQATMLRRLGCQFGQGYWFSPPLDGTALQAWLDERAAVGSPERAA